MLGPDTSVASEVWRSPLPGWGLPLLVGIPCACSLWRKVQPNSRILQLGWSNLTNPSTKSLKKHAFQRDAPCILRRMPSNTSVLVPTRVCQISNQPPNFSFPPSAGLEPEPNRWVWWWLRRGFPLTHKNRWLKSQATLKIGAAPS